MRTDRCVVGGETELRGCLADRLSLDLDPLQDVAVLGRERFGEGRNALADPLVQSFVREGRGFPLALKRSAPGAVASGLVDENPAKDAEEPRNDPRCVSWRSLTRQDLRERGLQQVVRCGWVPHAPRQEGQEPLPLGKQDRKRIGNDHARRRAAYLPTPSHRGGGATRMGFPVGAERCCGPTPLLRGRPARRSAHL
jgi:hypothetical protein